MAPHNDERRHVRVSASGWQVPAWALGAEGVVDRQTRGGNYIISLGGTHSDRASTVSAKPSQVEWLMTGEIDTPTLDQRDLEVDQPPPTPATPPPTPKGGELASAPTSGHLERSAGQRAAVLLAVLVALAGATWALMPFSTWMPVVDRQQQCAEWGGAFSEWADYGDAKAVMDELTARDRTLMDSAVSSYLRSAIDRCHDVALSRLRQAGVAIGVAVVLAAVAMISKPSTGRNSSPNAEDDPIEQIRRLASLRDDQAITAADFEDRKRDLLQHLNHH